MGHSKDTLHFLLRFWPIGRFLNWLGRQPPLSRLLRRWLGPEQNHAVIIPIHEVIQGTQNVALPIELIKPLVEQASDRIILNECICRKAENCRQYSHDIGCLFLGSGAAQIHPTLGKRVDREEALLHVERAVQTGLVPLVIHAAFDAAVLGIPYKQMLAICFCCDCCCTVRAGLRFGPPAFWDAVQRLPGLTIQISEDCVGCGTCLSLCHVKAIHLDSGHAVIGDLCKGCGRCVAGCPIGAIEIDICDVAGMSAFLSDSVRQRTDIGLTAH